MHQWQVVSLCPKQVWMAAKLDSSKKFSMNHLLQLSPQTAATSRNTELSSTSKIWNNIFYTFLQSRNILYKVIRFVVSIASKIFFWASFFHRNSQHPFVVQTTPEVSPVVLETFHFYSFVTNPLSKNQSSLSMTPASQQC